MMAAPTADSVPTLTAAASHTPHGLTACPPATPELAYAASTYCSAKIHTKITEITKSATHPAVNHLARIDLHLLRSRRSRGRDRFNAADGRNEPVV